MEKKIGFEEFDVFSADKKEIRELNRKSVDVTYKGRKWSLIDFQVTKKGKKVFFAYKIKTDDYGLSMAIYYADKSVSVDFLELFKQICKSSRIAVNNVKENFDAVIRNEKIIEDSIKK